MMCFPGYVAVTQLIGNTATEKLEYRGYDSVGVAIKNESDVSIKKGFGNDEMFLDKLSDHTRWATHGKVGLKKLFVNYSHHSLNNSASQAEFIPSRMMAGIGKMKSKKYSKISDEISEEELEREQDNITNVLKARDDLEDAMNVVEEKKEEYTNRLEKHFDDSLS